MVNHEVVQWARNRLFLTEEKLAQRIGTTQPIIQKWERGSKQPTLNQVKKLSRILHIPLGYFYSTTLPDTTLPIQDFRTHNNETISDPSPNLLDVIYDAQRKQEWYREYLEKNDVSPVFTQEHSISNVQDTVDAIRDFLNIENLRSESNGFRGNKYQKFIQLILHKLDEQGVVVIKSGIVGSNTHRSLDAREFRGFTLYDEYAPLIFVNNNDFYSAQIFTIIHELAHLFRRESGVDNIFHSTLGEQACNKIAAEVLVPSQDFKFRKGNEQNIANQFIVSTSVILIKAFQLQHINQKYLNTKWESIKREWQSKKDTLKGKYGGNYYASISYRTGGKRFLTAVFRSTLEGETLYRDAYNLTHLGSKAFSHMQEELNIN